jgi:hypothetical protein
MRERAFNLYAHEVRAVLEGRQTQVRRVVKGVPSGAVSAGVITSSTNAASEGEWWWLDAIDLMDAGVVGDSFRCPYGQPGDRLWVRETWGPCDGGACYRADENAESLAVPDGGRWRPSIHMPRWASRIDLEVTGVRVERLQDISDADAIAEGSQEPSLVPITGARLSERAVIAALWESIHGPGSWGANPFVWVVEFKRDQGERPQC